MYACGGADRNDTAAGRLLAQGKDDIMADNEKDLKEEEMETASGAPRQDQEGTSSREAASAAEEAQEENGDDILSQDAEDETAEDGGSGPKTWAEKMAAKKQAKMDKKSDTVNEKIAELEDKARRQLAEFENFRKRTEREKQSMFETGAKSVIEKILPVVDNFERGLATVPEGQKEDPFVDGMMRVYKQMMTELENIGVKPIEAVGAEFDPALHNAVMQVESEEYEAGIVAQELLKGYTYRDSVVRHSMVAVVSE